jgi:hypothetical protein
MALRLGPYGDNNRRRRLALGAVGAVPSLGVVEGGEIPKPKSSRKETELKRLVTRSEIKCYLPGVPRATYMRTLSDCAKRQRALVRYEYAGAVKYLSEGPRRPADSGWASPSDAGKVTPGDRCDRRNDQTWFDRAGNFHTDKLHGGAQHAHHPDVISYEATIEDDVSRAVENQHVALPARKMRLLDSSAWVVEELLYGEYRNIRLTNNRRIRICRLFIYETSAVGIALGVISNDAPCGGLKVTNIAAKSNPAHAGRTSGLAGTMTRAVHDDTARAPAGIRRS